MKVVRKLRPLAPAEITGEIKEALDEFIRQFHSKQNLFKNITRGITQIGD